MLWQVWWPPWRNSSMSQRTFGGYCHRDNSSIKKWLDREWIKHTDTEVTQLCPTLCNPMDYSPPGSSVHGIFQARVLEWVAISFNVLHIYNGILLSYKKEWNNSTCRSMEGSRDYHTRWSKSHRERQISYFTYMWYLIKMMQMTYVKIETDSDLKIKFLVTKGEM